MGEICSLYEQFASYVACIAPHRSYDWFPPNQQSIKKCGELIVEECYKAGAAQVRVEWSHQALQLLNVKYQSVDRLGSMAEWERQKLLYRAETLPASIIPS